MKTISEIQRSQYADIAELYEEAKNQDNGPLMEKLTKTMGQLAKQIKEQELHDRETLPRSECTRLSNLQGIALGRAIKKYLPDDEMANLILEHVHDELIEMSKDKDL